PIPPRPASASTTKRPAMRSLGSTGASIGGADARSQGKRTIRRLGTGGVSPAAAASLSSHRRQNLEDEMTNRRLIPYLLVPALAACGHGSQYAATASAEVAGDAYYEPAGGEAGG